MKKFYQMLATITLSVIVTGVYAQTSIKSVAGFHKTAKSITTIHQSHSGKKAEGAPTNYFLDYVAGDETINSTGTFYYWLPPAYFNMHYTLADTVTSPWTSATANTDLINYVTVAFDTLWDAYTKSYVTPVLSSASDSIYVDTLWAYMAYHNTSGTNDTLIFQVCAVDANGFPTATQYTADTVLIGASTLKYNVLDSVQFVDIIPAAPISIPRKATHGWNFCIKMKNYGSKLDTVGVWYFSQGTTCTTFDITNAYTSIGVADGRAPHVNSFYSGEYWVNDLKNGGNGHAINYPNYNTAYAGECANSAGIDLVYDQVFSAGCDTAYFAAQDIGIFASVSVGLPSPTAVNQPVATDFEVAQNAPNPFNTFTQINYTLAKASDVLFTVFDVTGRKLVENNYSGVAEGNHVINLSANEFTPGIYFYSFKVNGNMVTRKMIITQ